MAELLVDRQRSLRCAGGSQHKNLNVAVAVNHQQCRSARTCQTAEGDFAMMYEWEITVEGSEDSVRDAAARLKSILDPESCSPLVSVGTGSGAITLKGVSDEPSEISQVAELLAEGSLRLRSGWRERGCGPPDMPPRYQGHDLPVVGVLVRFAVRRPQRIGAAGAEEAGRLAPQLVLQGRKEQDPPSGRVGAGCEVGEDRAARGTPGRTRRSQRHRREQLAALDELAKELYLHHWRLMMQSFRTAWEGCGGSFRRTVEEKLY